jgi:hypothetical protein
VTDDDPAQQVSTGRLARPFGPEGPHATQAICRVRLAPGLSCEVFERRLRAMPAVLSAVHVTGDVDYELRLGCRDIAGIGDVLGCLRGCGDAEVASTALVLREVPGLGETGPAVPEQVSGWGRLPRPR